VVVDNNEHHPVPLGRFVIIYKCSDLLTCLYIKRTTVRTNSRPRQSDMFGATFRGRLPGREGKGPILLRDGRERTEGEEGKAGEVGKGMGHSHTCVFRN